MALRRLYPPLSALRAAEASARLGSFTAAAEELNISQSAVSQAVSLLEAQLGTALFERNKGGIAPTGRGQLYIDAIRPALGIIAAAGSEISAGRERVAIGCIRSLLHNWLLPRLPLFGARRPDLDLNVIGLGRDLAEGRRCDLGIVLEDLDRPPPDGILIAHEILIPLTSPSLASGLTQRLERYGGDLPAPLLGTGWDLWSRAAGLGGNVLHSGLQFRDASAALEAARAGQGIALGGSLICKDDISRGTLVRVSDIQLERGRGYWLLGRSSGSPLSAEFLSWLRQIAEE